MQGREYTDLPDGTVVRPRAISSSVVRLGIYQKSWPSILGGAKKLVRLLNQLAHRSPEKLSADVTQRLQISQLTSWAKISVVTVPVGIVVASMLFGTVWENRGDCWLDAGFAGILASYGLLFWFCWSWVRRGNSVVDVAESTRRLLLIRFALGCSWALALVMMARLDDEPSERSLLYGIAIGLMSTAVFGGPVLYALAFWLPVTAGAFGVLFATGSLLDSAPVICLCGYALLTFFAMLTVDRQIAERRLNSIKLEHHAETIGILLHDFEESASDWLWETDSTLTLRNVSARFAEVARAAARELEINLLQLLNGNADGETAEAVDGNLATLQERIEEKISFRQIVVPVKWGGQQRRWSLTGKPLFDAQGKFVGYRGVGSDVTAEHRSRERIAYMAQHDPLTGLLNRASFNEALLRATAKCNRQRAALLYVDVDELKSINDGHGHHVGDEVLRAIARRMREVLRESNTVARIGGDEFAILVPIREMREAVTVSERLIEVLGAPLEYGCLTIRTSVSIGIAIVPDHAQDRDSLCRNADLALYRSKSAGRCTWRLFDANMDRQVHERRLLQRDIRKALSDCELFVVYQPIVNLRSREMIGFEALVRWCHPERGIIPSEELVSLAEQSGTIHEIGTFVLTEAAKLIEQLPAPLFVAVNLSAVQVRDENLLTRVFDVLNRFAISPTRVEFEITESIMLETSGCSFDNLRALRSSGHRIGIDDFGTGYSSLAVLRRFSFDFLKIDRSFTADLQERKDAMVRAIINLARDLGISVTAEGVESERQVSILQSYRCPNAQGYYFSRPLSAIGVTTLGTLVTRERLGSGVSLPARSHLRAEESQRDCCQQSGTFGEDTSQLEMQVVARHG